MRYHECILNKEWQDSTITRIFSVGGLTGLLAVYLASKHYTGTAQLLQDVGLNLLQRIQRLQAIWF